MKLSLPKLWLSVWLICGSFGYLSLFLNGPVLVAVVVFVCLTILAIACWVLFETLAKLHYYKNFCNSLVSPQNTAPTQDNKPQDHVEAAVRSIDMTAARVFRKLRHRYKHDQETARAKVNAAADRLAAAIHKQQYPNADPYGRWNDPDDPIEQWLRDID